MLEQSGLFVSIVSNAYKTDPLYANNEAAPSSAQSFSVDSNEYQDYISVTTVTDTTSII